MKAWSASAVPGGQSTGNVVTQVSSDTESVESSPSAKSRETSPTASPMMPARRLVPASSGDELENEPDQGKLVFGHKRNGGKFLFKNILNRKKTLPFSFTVINDHFFFNLLFVCMELCHHLV